MVEIDLSTANLGRVAGQEVDALMIANQVVWEAAGPDGPYFVNDALTITPGIFTDGTPNIVTGHLCYFHNPGYVTGFLWYDGSGAAGTWILNFYLAGLWDGKYPETNSPLLGQKSVASAGSGIRQTALDTPVAVVANQMYLVTRYSSIGRYNHTFTGWSGPKGAYTDADPVCVPDHNQDVSARVPGWTGAYKSIYRIGGGNVVPQTPGTGGPYYGVTPIFYKSL